METKNVSTNGNEETQVDDHSQEKEENEDIFSASNGYQHDDPLHLTDGLTG